MPQRLLGHERHASVLQRALLCRLRGVHAPAPKYDSRVNFSVRQVQEQELAAARQETEALQQQLADQRSSLSQLLKKAQAENSGLRIALAKAQATVGAHQQAAEQAERSLQDAQSTNDLKAVQVGCRMCECKLSFSCERVAEVYMICVRCM